MTKLARVYHPDTGGSQEQMIRVNAAYDAAHASREDNYTLGPLTGAPRGQALH
jgi:hypothetical protein